MERSKKALAAEQHAQICAADYWRLHDRAEVADQSGGYGDWDAVARARQIAVDARDACQAAHDALLAVNGG
jgi:hypothetical protein